MERPHYEEYDMNESSMTVWSHPNKDVSVDWNKHGHKFTVHVKGEKVSGHATQKSAVAAANRRARQMDESKTYRDFVTEAAKRGRPRKLRPGEEADTLHIQDQLNKLTHPNHVEVHFKDGSKHRIPREHANMALHHLSSLKPIERAEHAEHMAKSHGDFYHVLSKKSIPSKKKGISLAGPKLRNEEVELDEANKPERGENSWPTRRDRKTGEWGWANSFKSGHKSKEAAEHHAKVEMEKGKRTKVKLSDLKPGMKKEEIDHDDDGWYAHKEMHGSKAISKEDWKKGVRPKKSMKKEEVDKPKQNTKTDVIVRKHTRLAADALGRAHHLGKDHKDYEKHMAEYARHRKLALGEEAEQIDEWGRKAISGPHAKTSSMAIHPPKVGYKGKQKKPKVQELNTEEAVIEEKLGFAKLKAKLSHKAGIKDPSALAASIGRKKYGKEKFQKMAAAGKEKKD